MTKQLVENVFQEIFNRPVRISKISSREFLIKVTIVGYGQMMIWFDRVRNRITFYKVGDLLATDMEFNDKAIDELRESCDRRAEDAEDWSHDTQRTQRAS
jgi:hypothetical protein